ncbi:MAG: signal recognition particle protein [Proteobacteria bacterium]|nr:signal recognition particle protein [Pseudomonadota bacterium]
MFENLTNKLGSVFDSLKKRGALKADDVDAALREIRVALLEADVALPVAKDFIEKVRAEAVGEKVLRSVQPGQQVVKIVHDTLVDTLGHDNAELNLNVVPPAVILMTGLQGSGKTTSAGKLAKFLKDRQRKKVLLASLDIYRPAAQEQLEILAKQAEVVALQTVTGEKPLQITRRALTAARLGGYDVLILDSAGRLSIDDALMAELAAVRDLARPVETLLVADALTGQDAVTTAQNFHQKIGITGIILTRVDGDARGGAALSMRAITGQPIKFLGLGEQMDALQAFDARRIAGRILDMGDIVSLVEKAAEHVELAEAQRTAKPEVLNASRRKRIAAGSGTSVQEVNRLLKQFQDMQTMMKRMNKLGGKGMMRALGGMLGSGTMSEMDEMAKNMQAQGDGILGPNPFPLREKK